MELIRPSRGDRIRITADGKTVESHVNAVSDDGSTVFVSINGALSIGGRLVFSSSAFALDGHGRWTEATTGAPVAVELLH